MGTHAAPQRTNPAPIVTCATAVAREDCPLPFIEIATGLGR